MISLPCKPSSALDWEIKVPEEGQILWHFDLGLEDPFFPIDDAMHFESLKMALQKFTKELWPNFQERTKGAVLYRGSADFSSSFSWTENQLENLETWKKGKESTPHLLRLFTADAFVHYFQMLVFSLPDELPVFLFLDAAIKGSLAEKHQLLSRERFEHFQVAIKDLPFTSALLWDGSSGMRPSEKPPRALCFPLEKMCSLDILEKLQTRLDRIEKPFRVISEAFLNEDWEGVDELHVLEEVVSKHGQRKVKGFEATGGKVSG